MDHIIATAPDESFSFQHADGNTLLHCSEVYALTEMLTGQISGACLHCFSLLGSCRVHQALVDVLQAGRGDYQELSLIGKTCELPQASSGQGHNFKSQP